MRKSSSRRAWPWLGLTLAGLLLGSAVTAVAQQDSCRGTAMAEVAADVGIHFVHARGETGNFYNPETMGSGVAWFDYDGDGWLDCYLVQSGPFPPTEEGSAAATNQMFRNTGNGRFENVTERTGSGERSYGQGVLGADFDGDRMPDIFLANWGVDRLLMNRGDGTFEDRTAESGVDVEGANGWSSGAALGDADRDGDLDLYLVIYVEHDPEHEPFCLHPSTGERWYCGPSPFEPKMDIFFRNQGSAVFKDETLEAGFETANGKGLGVLFVDLNGDNWPDVYVANDMTFNLLFVNKGDGTFEDLSLMSGVAVSRDGMPEAGMGVAVGDVDGDGDADMAVANFDVQTNTLYTNQGDFFFEDTSAASGFGAASFNYVGFGLVMADFNRDGHMDFFNGTGHTVEISPRANVYYEQPDVLLLGDGKGNFAEPDCPLPNKRPSVSRGVADADYDNDGDRDIGIQRSGRAFSLLRNDAKAGSWLGLRLWSNTANSEGVGAVATLTTSQGVQKRWVIAGSSYQSSSDIRVLFGFDEKAEIHEVEILWQSGKVQRILQPPLESYLTVREPL